MVFSGKLNAFNFSTVVVVVEIVLLGIIGDLGEGFNVVVFGIDGGGVLKLFVLNVFGGKGGGGIVKFGGIIDGGGTGGGGIKTEGGGNIGGFTVGIGVGVIVVEVVVVGGNVLKLFAINVDGAACDVVGNCCCNNESLVEDIFFFKISGIGGGGRL